MCAVKVKRERESVDVCIKGHRVRRGREGAFAFAFERESWRCGCGWRIGRCADWVVVSVFTLVFTLVWCVECTALHLSARGWKSRVKCA